MNRDGWYRVTEQQLAGSGFDTLSDSSNWRLFLNASEVPIIVNADRSIEFYGTGQDTRESDKNVYFLVNGDQPGLRVADVQEPGTSGSGTASSFLMEASLVERTTYIANVVNGAASNWFGSVVSQGGPTAKSIDLVNLYADDPNATVRLKFRIQGYSYAQHAVSVQVNNYQAGVVNLVDRESIEFQMDIPITEFVEGANSISFQSVGSGYDLNLLESISITYPRKFEAVSGVIKFGVAAGDTAVIKGFSSPDVSVFEVVDGKVSGRLAVNVTNIDGTYGFGIAQDTRNRVFYAVSNSAAFAVAGTSQNVPSAWNDSSNSADVVILAPAQLESPANDLAALRSSEGFAVSVVLAEDVADEFGFGSLTGDAVKSFLQHAVFQWSNGPQYVILFGDSSYDPRNFHGLSNNRNLIPTRMIDTFDMETSSDGSLVDFDDDGVEDIAVGRIPSGTLAEADAAVAKLARYSAETSVVNTGSAALVADNFFEILNQELENQLPGGVTSTRIERSVLGDSQMATEIQNNANSDPSVVSYLGHGTTSGWSTANVFSNPVAANLTNQKLSFYMLMTCLNGYTHNRNYDSLAESLVKSQNGAIAVWASSGSTYASGQISMGQQVMWGVFNSNQRIGDIVRSAKQSSGDMDARRTWQLMGDPTIVIH